MIYKVNKGFLIPHYELDEVIVHPDNSFVLLNSILITVIFQYFFMTLFSQM